MTSAAVATMTTDSTIAKFEQSFPLRYSTIFGKIERGFQAEVCARRQAGGVSAGIIPSQKAGQTVICVCAEDRPGVLSLISAALATLGFEIETAVAYRRSLASDATPEILDVFWLRDPSGIISEEDVSAFSNLLSEYLSSRPSLTAQESAIRSPSPSSTVVRFIEDSNGDLSILEVETSDRFGLLWEVSRALADCELQILSSEIITQGARVTDKFVVEESSGKPVSPDRRLEIQTAVLAALEF